MDTGLEENLDLPQYVDEGKLIVGKTYEVSTEDCCVQVYFTSKLLEISENDSDQYVTKWENGLVLEAKSMNCVQVGD